MLQERLQSGFHYRCFSPSMGLSAAIGISSSSSTSRVIRKLRRDKTRLTLSNGAWLRPCWFTGLHQLSISPPIRLPLLKVLRLGVSICIPPSVFPLHCMADLWFNTHEKLCIRDVQVILVKSRKMPLKPPMQQSGGHFLSGCNHNTWTLFIYWITSCIEVIGPFSQLCDNSPDICIRSLFTKGVVLCVFSPSGVQNFERSNQCLPSSL